MERVLIAGESRRTRRAWAMRLGETGLVVGAFGGGLWTATHGVAHVAWSDGTATSGSTAGLTRVSAHVPATWWVMAGAPRLLVASAGCIAAQVALLHVSLRTVGLHAPLTVVIMAAASERLGTLFPIRPGGTSVAEVGAIAWLIGTGLAA